MFESLIDRVGNWLAQSIRVYKLKQKYSAEVVKLILSVENSPAFRINPIEQHLYRTPYFVIPRLALETLPYDWQVRFSELLTEAYEVHKLQTPKYTVSRRDHKGRWFKDWWIDYRRGNAATCMQRDAELDERRKS